MKNICIAIMTLFFFANLQNAAQADPDTYVGDAAIYSAIDVGGTRPKPHILFLIDTSQATLNKAAGEKYIFDVDDPYASPYTGSYNSWDVYAANNQGLFSTLAVASTTPALEGITCSTAGGLKIKSTLLASGTYSGSGSVDAPNLMGGACDVAPKGGTYALGNYLNYLQGGTVAAVDNTFQHTYDCRIGVLQANRRYQYTTIADGCIGTFRFIGSSDHITDSSTEPKVGTDWTSVWTQTAAGCKEGATGCSANSIPPLLTVDAAIQPWELGMSLTGTVFSGDTQREIIYNALVKVVEGAKDAVKFGAMVYNPNNQGGDVIYDSTNAPIYIDDLNDATKFEKFKLGLPGQNADGTLFGAPLINSLTNRPQAEALFDAGYYLGARYPTTGTIATTAEFPLDNATFTRQNIGTPMAGKYRASNRNECEYNHIILITNGLSNGDGSAGTGPLARIVDADSDGRLVESVYGGGSHYLDDVAAYLYKQEKIITHTVLAFQTADPLIEGAANGAGGKFYNVYDANSLSRALTELMAGIVLENDTSFVAPVVPASSTNRTISSNRVYLGLFKPQSNRPWVGNLKKYGVSSDLTLQDRNGITATDQYGDFLPNSKSYWGDDGSVDKKIMSMDGLLPLKIGSTSGDGGNVGAGGVGGTLILDLKAGLAASPVKQAWETRNIYTWPSGSASTTLTHADNRFSPTNAKITAATFALDADKVGDKDKLINFVAGADGYDDDKNFNSTEIRDWVLGDILHSKPLIFSYNKYLDTEETDCSKNKSMIFVGSNDGMFHAFRDCDGKEAWAFIPDNVLPNLKYLRNSTHLYLLDSAPTAYVHDVDGDNIVDAEDKVLLIFGQGRGGGSSTLDAGSRGSYYALDVSNPLVPVLRWKIDSTTTGFAELGETWTPPRLAKVKDGSEVKVVAFIGAGYDNNEDIRFGNNMLFPDTTTTATNVSASNATSGDLSSPGTTSARPNPRGRGLFAIEIATLKQDYAPCTGGKYCPDFTETGSLVWSFVKANDNGQGMDYSIPSDLTVLDMNSDGFQDRIYVGDTGGRLWRFDVGSTNTADWTNSGRIIFNSNKVGGETNVGRKIFYRPTVAILQGVPTLYFGTGDRNHPLNMAVTDRMFAVKDKGQLTANYIDVDNLQDLTSNQLQNSLATETQINDILLALAASDNYGWYVDLNENPGEKVLASALVFNKQAFYTTYTPLPTDSLDVCQLGNLGVSRLYQLNYATAESVQNYYSGNDTTTTYETNLRAKGGAGIGLQREDRVRNIGEGIPSGIVTLIDASGKVTLMISSSNRVGTYQAPDAKMISPLYWIKY